MQDGGVKEGYFQCGYFHGPVRLKNIIFECTRFKPYRCNWRDCILIVIVQSIDGATLSLLLGDRS